MLPTNYIKFKGTYSNELQSISHPPNLQDIKAFINYFETFYARTITLKKISSHRIKTHFPKSTLVTRLRSRIT